MENLNAEQVKKALQGHIGVVDMRCEECPYNQDNGSEICIDLLITDALALINSQEQDKEKLGLLIDEIVKEKRELFEENKRLTAENERLHASCTQLTQNLHECKADTVRKMQERLKAEMRNTAKYSFGGREYSVIGEAFIDQIAKEMLEGEE
jgi:hypothetical protein